MLRYRIRFKRNTLVLAYAHEVCLGWRVYEEREATSVVSPPTCRPDGTYTAQLRNDPDWATHLVLVPPGSFRVIEVKK